MNIQWLLIFVPLVSTQSTLISTPTATPIRTPTVEDLMETVAAVAIIGPIDGRKVSLGQCRAGWEARKLSFLGLLASIRLKNRF